MSRTPTPPFKVSKRVWHYPAYRDAGERRSSVEAPINIETENYQLRSLHPSDASSCFQEWLRDDELMGGLNLSPVTWSLQQVQSFIGSFDNRRKYIIGIVSRPTSELIGFYTIDVNQKHRMGQITVGIGDKRYLGKGVLAETAPALVDEFFMHRNLEKMNARVLARNTRMLFNFVHSKRFQLEGRLRKESLAPDGKRLDILTFGCLKTDNN